MPFGLFGVVAIWAKISSTGCMGLLEYFNEDLVHHIYTHLPPENHFKAGDPLPILYRIYRDENNREFVDSMPYPLPLDDIGELNNAVYHETGQ